MAAYKRRLGLDPPGPFFDDVWVAVSSLEGRWFEVVDHGLTAGGFTLAVCPHAVEEAIEGRDVVWLVGSPFTGVHLVRSVLQAAGFERAAIEERPVALLERWERT